MSRIVRCFIFPALSLACYLKPTGFGGTQVWFGIRTCEGNVCFCNR